jgi:hypothetical protein
MRVRHRSGLLVVIGACVAALALPPARAAAATPTCESSQLSMRVVSLEDASVFLCEKSKRVYPVTSKPGP